MIRLRHTVAGLCLVAFATVPSAAQLLPVLGAQRTGTATAQFLKIGAGARAASMGETFVAVANDVSALYWNPAGITQFSEDGIMVSHTAWLVDVRHEFAGLVYHLSSEDAVGFSVTAVHTDDMPVTTEVQPAGTGEYFTYGDVALGLTYSRKLTPQFSFGGTVRYFEETLDVLKMRGVVLDLGTYYWMGLGSARFSAVVSNFGNQIAPSGTAPGIGGRSVSQFQEFSPPTTFRFGFAFEPIADDVQMLTTSIQLNHPNDNSENIGVGAEYSWSRTFFVRGGYRLNADEQGLTLGAGVATTLEGVGISVDYGYSAFGRLGGVQRLALGVKL